MKPTTAAKGTKGIHVKLEENPDGVPVYLVETLHQTAVALDGEKGAQLTAEDLRANDYHLVAGDEAYLKGVMEGLIPLHAMRLSNHPNPFSGSTVIRYGLPAGFSRAEYRMKIHDSRGRMVWEKTVRSGGSLNFMWDGKGLRGAPIPAGAYTLVVEASTPGKTTYRAVRRLLKL